MNPVSGGRLPPIVTANDKLLKALISLLALRDPHLLDDLRTIFAMAEQEDNPIGEASDPIWIHLQAELRTIADLVENGDEDDLSEEVLRAAANVGAAKLI